MITDEQLAKMLEKHSHDVSIASTVRDERIPDLTFARITQLDDKMRAECTTEFLGQFDLIGRERKAVQAEFRQNEVEVLFRTKNGDDDDLDELMQGKYRTDTRLTKSQQAIKIAQDDAMDCGFGAWRVNTEEVDSEDMLNSELEVGASPLPEAIRCVFFESNSKLYDKSDARWCGVRNAMTEDAYLKWLEDEGIDEEDAGFISFSSPYKSVYEVLNGTELGNSLYNAASKEITLLEFYEIEEKVEMFYQYLSIDMETGEEKIVPMLKKDALALDGAPEPFRKKKVKVKCCKKYVTNGVKVLKESVVPGGMIPIIPIYGERNFCNGVENFYGIVKAAKDPQVLFNASMNYTASLMMRSPHQKPVVDPREIEGYDEWNTPNDPNHAYMRKNKTYVDTDGTIKQFMPEYTQPPQVAPAVAQLQQGLLPIMDMILNPGVTEDSFDSNMSGVAFDKVEKQIGILRYIMLDNYGDSMLRFAEVYAAMVCDTYDTPRKVVVTNRDGTTAMKKVNEETFDAALGASIVKNELKGAKFSIYSKVAPTYETQRQQEAATQREIYSNFADPNDKMAKATLYSIISNSSGAGSEELAKAARFEMLSMQMPGIEPQTEEEKQFVMQLQQAQQNQQPPIEAQIALMQEETRQLQAQQSMLKEQNMAQANQIKAYQAQTGAQNDQAKTQIDMFNAETKRGDMQINAQEAGANINNTEMDTLKKGVESQLMQADAVEKRRGMQQL